MARGALLKYSVVLRNKEPKTRVEGVGFKINLPNGVTVKKNSVFPAFFVDNNKGKHTIPPARVSGSTLDWENVPLGPKRKSYRFTVLVRVDQSAPSELIFTSLAYQSALADIPECEVFADGLTVNIYRISETKQLKQEGGSERG